MKILKSGSTLLWAITTSNKNPELDQKPIVSFFETRQRARDRVKDLRSVRVHMNVSMHKCIISKVGIITILHKKEY